MSRILILLPTTIYRAGAFVRAGQAEGIEIVIASERKQAMADLVPGRTLAVKLGQPDQALGQIRDHCTRHPVDAVIAVDEETVVLAARASEALGLPHNPVTAVEATRDKYLMRQKFTRAGLPSPRAVRLEITEDPGPAALKAAYPCVLKPTSLSASRGVIRADNPVEFEAAFTTIRDLLAEIAGEGRAAGPGRYILFEDYIPGNEVAVEGILQQGRLATLAIFDKPDPLTGPYFPETVYVTPSQQPPETRERIAAAVQDGARALGLSTGPIHAECRLNANGIFMIEIAARSIGGYCSKVLRFEPDHALEALILKQALGTDISGYSREAQAAGVMMIPPPRAGYLRSVGGRAAAEAVPGVEEIIFAIPVGHRVDVLPTASRYLGFIFARGSNPAGVRQALEQAHAALEIVIEAG